MRTVIRFLLIVLLASCAAHNQGISLESGEWPIFNAVVGEKSVTFRVPPGADPAHVMVYPEVSLRGEVASIARFGYSPGKNYLPSFSVGLQAFRYKQAAPKVNRGDIKEFGARLDREYQDGIASAKMQRIPNDEVRRNAEIIAVGGREWYHVSTIFTKRGTALDSFKVPLNDDWYLSVGTSYMLLSEQENSRYRHLIERVIATIVIEPNTMRRHSKDFYNGVAKLTANPSIQTGRQMRAADFWR